MLSSPLWLISPSRFPFPLSPISINQSMKSPCEAMIIRYPAGEFLLLFCSLDQFSVLLPTNTPSTLLLFFSCPNFLDTRRSHPTVFNHNHLRPSLPLNPPPFSFNSLFSGPRRLGTPYEGIVEYDHNPPQRFLALVLNLPDSWSNSSSLVLVIATHPSLPWAVSIIRSFLLYPESLRRDASS